MWSDRQAYNTHRLEDHAYVGARGAVDLPLPAPGDRGDPLHVGTSKNTNPALPINVIPLDGAVQLPPPQINQSAHVWLLGIGAAVIFMASHH